MPVALPVTEGPILVVVRNADLLPGAACPRSWCLPCRWCGEVCSVDPEALFGTKMFELVSLDPPLFARPTELPSTGKRICCMRCISSVALRDEHLEPKERLALWLVGESYVRAMARRAGGDS